MSTDPILAGLQQIGGLKPSATVQPSAPDYHAMAIEAANRNKVPVNLMLAQTQQESGFNPNAVSPQGAIGISQFTPATAKQWGVDPTDPASALDGQARLMRHYLDVANGDQRTALKMYYGGPSQSDWGAKTNAYPDQVFGHMQGGDPASGGNNVSPAPANDPILQGLNALSNGAAPQASPNQPQAPTGPSPAAQPGAPSQQGWGSYLASMTPVTNALVNGGDDKLGTFAKSAWDSDLGMLNGPAHIPGTILNLAGDAIDATGYGKKAADTLHNWAGDLDNLGKPYAFDPNSNTFKAASLAGNVAATAPVSELKLMEGVPALSRAVASREGMRAIGQTAPLATRLAAGLARYGDMSIQGGVAGAASSGGNNMGTDALYGALGAPVIGAAADKVIAPVVGKASDMASALLNYGKKDAPALTGNAPVAAADIAAFRKAYPELGDASDADFAQAIQRSRQGDPVPAQANDTPAPVQTIRKGADALPVMKAPPGVAQFDEDGAPLVGMQTIDGKQVPQYGVAGQPGSRALSPAQDVASDVRGAVKAASAQPGAADLPPGYTDNGDGTATAPTGQRTVVVDITGDNSAADKNAGSAPPQNPRAASSQLASIPSDALGSRGARTGIEAHDQMPDDVAAIYKPLVAQGVSPDEALREADIRAVGGSPTAADVTRNPAMMTAVKEGAKADTTEGQALNLQQAQNNAALHSTAQDAVAGFGGAPAPGEAMQTAATSLLDASKAERQNVTSLYKQADAEAATAKGVSDTATQNAQDKADLEAGVAAKLAARQKLDAAQEEYRTAKAATGVDPSKAQAKLAKARANYRSVSDNPPKAPPVSIEANPGYIDLSKLRSALNTPELSNPTTEGAKSMRGGVLGLMDAYKAKGDLYTAKQAEALRQAVGDAYDPMGGSINHHVGNLKGVIDTAMDDATAGPAYKKARAAHKAWADKYENPEGVAKLIRTDAKGNLVHDDAWRSAENLVGAKNDRPLIQIVNRLKANGDTATVNKLKALVVQDAYEHATGRAAGNAADQMANSLFSGSRFHARLNTIGMNKLKVLFTPSEIAKLASIGRAGVAINEAVPGTVNTSHTAMAVTNALRKMDKTEPGLAGKIFDKVMHGAPLAGGLHSGIEGVAAGIALNMTQQGARATATALAKRKAAAEMAEALKRMSDPREVRAFEANRAQQIARELQRRAAADPIARAGGRAVGGVRR